MPPRTPAAGTTSSTSRARPTSRVSTASWSSDHVVFGEDLDAYARARARRRGGRAPAHRPRRPLARAPDRPHRGRGPDRPGPPRDLHPPRRAAPPRGAGQAGRDARRAVPRPPRPRCRHRLAARGVRGVGARLRRPRPAARPDARGLPDAVARRAGIGGHARAQLRGHPRDAEARAARRPPGLGERTRQHPCRAAARPLRPGLDPLGRGRGRPRDRGPEDAGRGRAGRRRPRLRRARAVPGRAGRRRRRRTSPRWDPGSSSSQRSASPTCSSHVRALRSFAEAQDAYGELVGRSRPRPADEPGARR